MSRGYIRASSEYHDSAQIWTGDMDLQGVVVSAWFYANTTSSSSAIMGFGRDGDASKSYYLYVNSASKALTWSARNGGVNSAITTTTVSDDTWHHGFAVVRSAVSRSVWLDDGGVNTVTASKDFNQLDRTVIGARSQGGGHDLFWDGYIVDVAIWDYSQWGADDAARDLYADNVRAQCAAGMSAEFFRTGLKNHWKMVGGTGDLYDSGPEQNTLAETGTVTDEDNPRLFYPRRTTYSWPVAAAAGGLSIPVAMHNYRRLRTA